MSTTERDAVAPAARGRLAGIALCVSTGAALGVGGTRLAGLADRVEQRFAALERGQAALASTIQRELTLVGRVIRSDPKLAAALAQAAAVPAPPAPVGSAQPALRR